MPTTHTTRRHGEAACDASDLATYRRAEDAMKRRVFSGCPETRVAAGDTGRERQPHRVEPFVAPPQKPPGARPRRVDLLYPLTVSHRALTACGLGRKAFGDRRRAVWAIAAGCSDEEVISS